MNPDELMARLSADDASIRSEAVEDIGWDDVGAALDALVLRLTIEPSQSVREGIVVALARLSDPRVPACTAALLSHEDAFIRNGALTILQQKGLGSLDALEAAFRAGDADVRKLVIDATSSCDATQVDALYEAAIVDENINVRIAALEGIEDHRRDVFRERLEELFLVESNPMLVTALLSALLAIGAESTWTAIRSRYPGLESAPAHQRALWIRALGRWAGPSGVELLRDVVACLPRNAESELFDALMTLQERHPRMEIPEPLLDWLRSRARADAPTPLGLRIREWLATVPALGGGFGTVRPPAARRGKPCP
jgi:hypothetical protein